MYIGTDNTKIILGTVFMSYKALTVVGGGRTHFLDFTSWSRQWSEPPESNTFNVAVHTNTIQTLKFG